MELCHNKKCTGFAQIQGLCWSCKLRYNTTDEKLMALKKEVYSRPYLDTALADKISKEIARRKSGVCGCLERSRGAKK